MNELVPIEATPLVVYSGYDQALSALLSEVGVKTARSYGAAVREYLRWLADNPVDHPAIGLAEFAAHEKDRGLSPATVNKKMAAITRFYSWAAALNLISHEQFLAVKEVKRPKVQGQKRGKWLTQEQMQELLNSPDTSLTGWRDKAVLALLMGCGLRRSEVVSLRWQQITKLGGSWIIENLERKHGRIQDVVPVPDWVKFVLDEYKAVLNLMYKATNRHVQPSDYIMVRVYRNEKTVSMPLGDQSIRLIVQRYTDVAPHDLRRSYARAARQNSADLSQLQIVLGHNNIETTQRYVNEILDIEAAANFVVLSAKDNTDE